MPTRTRVYVSGPLSTGDTLKNVETAIEAGRALIAAGFAAWVPHLTHYMDPDDSLGYENWIQTDLAWVGAADAVVRLPGASSGADRECALARSLGIPVYDGIDALLATR